MEGIASTNRGSSSLLIVLFCVSMTPEDELHNYVFPLAILFSKEKRLLGDSLLELFIRQTW